MKVSTRYMHKRWLLTSALTVVAAVAFASASQGAGQNQQIDLTGSATAAAVAKNKGKNPDAADNVKTTSPIKHVIVLIGENRGLDHTFGIYKPKGRGQTISNVLSKGILNIDGTPGPHFHL